MKKFISSEEFVLENGETLAGLEIAYQTWGELNASKDNVIWICHALTGNSDAADWWPNLIGKGRVLDTDRFFVICANMLGSCYGSTGPLSLNPSTGTPYLHDFPQLTNRDIVQGFELLRQNVGITRIHILMGGSTGGQQVLEWAISHPDAFERIVPVATNAVHSPWGIGFNESQRMAIAADSSWQEDIPEAGAEGLRTARSIALLSYRSYEIYNRSQEETDLAKTDDYKASSYQQYQGSKLLKRFNAFSYWILSKAMDSQQVGRGRGSTEEALARIKAKTLVMGVKSDILFPLAEQQFLADHIPGAKLVELESLHGHDGFLVETDQIETHLRHWLAE